MTESGKNILVLDLTEEFDTGILALRDGALVLDVAREIEKARFQLLESEEKGGGIVLTAHYFPALTVGEADLVENDLRLFFGQLEDAKRAMSISVENASLEGIGMETAISLRLPLSVKKELDDLVKLFEADYGYENHSAAEAKERARRWDSLTSGVENDISPCATVLCSTKSEAVSAETNAGFRLIMEEALEFTYDYPESRSTQETTSSEERVTCVAHFARKLTPKETKLAENYICGQFKKFDMQTKLLPPTTSPSGNATLIQIEFPLSNKRAADSAITFIMGKVSSERALRTFSV
jgi:hypothetical protein